MRLPREAGRFRVTLRRARTRPATRLAPRLRCAVRRAAPGACSSSSLLVPVARADGDPASDVLLTQDVFLPYAPPASPSGSRPRWSRWSRRRKDGRLPDEGRADQHRGGPRRLPAAVQQPASSTRELLYRELATLNPHGDPVKDVHLLVVMPGGFGGANLGEGVDRALAPVTIDAEARLGRPGSGRDRRGRPDRDRERPRRSRCRPRPRLASSGSEDSGGGGAPAVLFVAPALLLFAGLFVAGRVAARRAPAE